MPKTLMTDHNKCIFFHLHCDTYYVTLLTMPLGMLGTHYSGERTQKKAL